MKRKHWLGRLVFAVFTVRNRHNYRQNTNKKLDVIVELINEVKKIHDRTDNLGLADCAVAMNAMLFVLLLDLDLSVVLFDQAAEDDGPKKDVYSKALALLVWEGLDDVPSVLGKGFRLALSKLNAPADLASRIGEPVSQIAALKRAHSKVLNEIRDVAAAHRDHNAVVQLALLESLDHAKLRDIAILLLHELSALHVCFGDVLRAVRPSNPNTVHLMI